MSKGFYDRELSDSLPDAMRAISARLSGFFRVVSKGISKFKTPFLVTAFVSLSIGIIGFISWYRTPSLPIPPMDSSQVVLPEEPEQPPAQQQDAPSTPKATDFSSFRASKSAKAFVRETWPMVLQNCPGLQSYASDYVITGIDDMHESNYGSDVRGIGVTIRIMDVPASIPAGFGAGGHTCNYRVTMDKRNIIFEKDVCMEVCKDRNFTHSSSNRVIPLY